MLPRSKATKMGAAWPKHALATGHSGEGTEFLPGPRLGAHRQHSGHKVQRGDSACLLAEPPAPGSSCTGALAGDGPLTG